MGITRDPKGYYIALGLSEDCDADAVKAAYRAKAKRLHPDFNPSPIAAKQFHRLHEAYSTLNDPAKRAAYDKPWKSEGSAKAKAKPESEARAEPRAEARAETKPRPKPEPKPEAKPEPARTEKAQSQARDPGVEQPAVCKCGKVTAQPRYLVFDLVWGRLRSVQRKGIAGIFCRSCADRTAVKASLITWIAGWWAWPDGPRETVRALLNNIRGGRKPSDRNARLLIRQARAFRGRGEMELARNAAEQALTFAVTPALRREVDEVLNSLSAIAARPLKNRWSEPGWAPMVQVLPLALMVAALSMTVTMSGFSPVRAVSHGLQSAARFLQRPLPFFAPAPTEAAPTDAAPPALSAAPAPSSLAVGRVYSVTVDGTALRTGPGTSYQMVAMMPQGAVVLAIESDPTGAWLRVTTADGAAGFLPAAALSPDVRVDALKDVGGFTTKP